MDHGGTHRAAGAVIGSRYRLDGPATSTSGVPAWRALDSWSGRPVTVHLVGPPAHLPSARHAAWIAEAEHYTRRLAPLRGHPNLAVVLDVVHDGGQLWTVTDWTTARSLQEIVRTSGPIPHEHLRVIAHELLEGLGALHSLGLTHGGLTPESVHLSADRRVVMVCAGVPPDGAAPARLLAYRAPEQLDGLRDDQAADMFSVGAVTYFAAEGRGPFDQGDDAAATRYAVMYQLPPPPMRAGNLAGPILAMLARQPAARPTAATALALFAAARPASFPSAPPGGYLGGGFPAGPAQPGSVPPGSVPPGSLPPGSLPPDQRGPSRRPLYAGAAAALIVLVGIAVALVLASADSSSAPKASAHSQPTVAAPPPSVPSTTSPSPSPSRTRAGLPTRPPPGGGIDSPGQTDPGTEDNFDPSIRREFLASCTSASDAPAVCECAIEEFEARYTQDEFVQLGRHPDSPESREALNEVISLCATTTDA